MEKMTLELWTSLQGLDKDQQIALLKDYTEEVYASGFSDGEDANDGFNNLADAEFGDEDEDSEDAS